MATVAMKKPALTFFKYRYSTSVPAFLLRHSEEHVRCLSEFFKVTVIDQDCDYRQICDQHSPEMAVFESGPNLPGCRAISIRGTSANRHVPKVGLFNADAWAETRSRTLSEMDHWGIETFFAISTTAAEHSPELAKHLFVWPNFIDGYTYRDYGESKLIPVLLSGSTGPQYPWRRRVFQLLSQRYPCLSCPHHGYITESGSGQTLFGERYARVINASLVAPVCGTVAKEVVRKHFEIPGCNACLITQDSPGLRAAGFLDMENCVFAEESDVLDKIAYLFQHPENLRLLSAAGYRLVHSRHRMEHRDQLLQWFELHKSLRADERIVQTGPFEKLAVVGKASKAELRPTVSIGLHLELLSEGDRYLCSGRYDKAEQAYLASLNYMRRLPEAKLRLAICNLCEGKAGKAKHWICELLELSLAEYEAADPDPVEWAYFIISLLCLGKTGSAGRLAKQFAWLRHPELERARWASALLSDYTYQNIPARSGPFILRCSVHSLPKRSSREWTRELCIMLRACGRPSLANTVEKSLALDEPAFLQEDDIDGSTAKEERERRSLMLNLSKEAQTIRAFKLRLAYKGVRSRLNRKVRYAIDYWNLRNCHVIH